MSDVRDLLARSLSFLLDPGGFRITRSSPGASSGGGESVTLESAALRLQLVRDRSEMSLRLQPRLGTPDEWFWIGVVRRALDGDRPGSDRLDDAAVRFLRARLGELETRFADEEDRPRLTELLRKARDDRAAEIFGQP